VHTKWIKSRWQDLIELGLRPDDSTVAHGTKLFFNKVLITGLVINVAFMFNNIYLQQWIITALHLLAVAIFLGLFWLQSVGRWSAARWIATLFFSPFLFSMHLIEGTGPGS
jgi:hypothetical protein